jgi:hypothetical protein
MGRKFNAGFAGCGEGFGKLEGRRDIETERQRDEEIERWRDRELER